MSNSFVNDPVPGPTSKIGSANWPWTNFVIFLEMLVSIKKFCPSLYFGLFLIFYPKILTHYFSTIQYFICVLQLLPLERSWGVSPSNFASFAPVYLIYVGLFLLPLKGSGVVDKERLFLKVTYLLGFFLLSSCKSCAVS